MINDDIIAFLYYIETQIGEIIRPGWSEPFPRLLPSERLMSDGQQRAAGSRELEMRKTQILGGGWKTNRWQAERRPDNLFQGYYINPRHRTTKNLFQATSSKGSGLILGASLLPNTAAMDVRFWMKSDCFVKLFFGSVDNLFCQVLSRVVFL